MQPITIVYLVLILIFAVIVVAGLWWGIRKRRERHQADAELEAEGQIKRVDRDAAVPTPADERTSEPAAPDASPPPEPGPAEPAAAPAEPAAAPESTPLATEPAVPVAPPPPPVAESGPTTAIPSTPTPASDPGDVDTLTMLKGVGPKVATRLNELGITRYDQLAALDPDEAEALDAQLGNFKGRMARDRWIEQADLLARGEHDAYEATFGKLG